MRKWPLLVLLVLAAAPAARADEHVTSSASLNTSALQPGQQAVLAVVLDIADGYHAQSHTPVDPHALKTRLEIDTPASVTAYEPIYPAGQELTTLALGRISVYSGRTIIYVPLTVRPGAAAGDAALTVRVFHQICDDQTCFAETKETLSVSTQILGAAQAASPQKPELFAGFDPKVFAHLLPAQAPDSGPAVTFSLFGLTIDKGSHFLALLAALFVGVIFNVMPCVLPVLPLKALGFYQLAQNNRARSLSFGITFGLGIMAAFAALALLVFVGHQNWGQSFSNPWFLGAFVVILVVMAMGLFGFFTFNLPAGVYSLDSAHDTYVGNFLFGIFTAILSTPCTAPLLPPLLAWAAAQPLALGIATIMTTGLGMALPYVLLSAFPELARRLPRTGPWSELIKQMMGFLLLAVAAFLAGQRLLPGADFVWAVLAVIVAAAVFLVVRTARLMPRPRPITIASIIALGLVAGSAGLVKALDHPELPWTPYSKTAFDDAMASGHVVLIDFTAGWCGNCQYVDLTVFGQARVQKALLDGKVELLKADLTTDSAAGWEKIKQLSPSGGIPLTVIYSPRRSQPIVLESVYRPQSLLDALAQATGR